jgi:hypothetical protein
MLEIRFSILQNCISRGPNVAKQPSENLRLEVEPAYMTPAKEKLVVESRRQPNELFSGADCGKMKG